MDNEKVIFKGKIYTVIHKYDSDYWEVREEGHSYNAELVHKSQVEVYVSVETKDEN
ncbi:hypothetical protein [Peribacillus sp. SCS-155]|uniref:hypothetical protein n=1 Tax=Peribacillus sedimenti TaxID=3115297 RepID=UPI0039059CFC